jgi:hypothetical protein
VSARAAYLEGVDRLLHAKPGPEQAFALAIARDPDFALAHAGLARAQRRLIDMTLAAARAVH